MKDNVDLIVWVGGKPTYHRNLSAQDARRLSHGVFDGLKCKIVSRTPVVDGVSIRTQRWGAV
jgi:hypothetical protein